MRIWTGTIQPEHTTYKSYFLFWLWFGKIEKGWFSIIYLFVSAICHLEAEAGVWIHTPTFRTLRRLEIQRPSQAQFNIIQLRWNFAENGAVNIFYLMWSYLILKRRQYRILPSRPAAAVTPLWSSDQWPPLYQTGTAGTAPTAVFNGANLRRTTTAPTAAAAARSSRSRPRPRPRLSPPPASSSNALVPDPSRPDPSRPDPVICLKGGFLRTVLTTEQTRIAESNVEDAARPETLWRVQSRGGCSGRKADKLGSRAQSRWRGHQVVIVQTDNQTEAAVVGRGCIDLMYVLT